MEATAYSPAGLSGFFSPHITSDLLETGAIGGGVAVDKGVYVRVRVLEDRPTGIKTFINGEPIESDIVEYVVREFCREYSVSVTGELVVEQEIQVPIGGGYGTSAASALAVAIALARLYRVKTTLEKLAVIAHKADIVTKHGLGTVVGILEPCDGVVLVVKPGGPGRAVIEHILDWNNLYVLTAYYGSIDKTKLLSDIPGLEFISRIGYETLENILREPCIENFIRECLQFSRKTGLLKKPLENVIERVNSVRGVIGFSMTMVGDAVFGFVEKDSIEDAVDAIVKTRRPQWIHYWRLCRCYSL